MTIYLSHRELIFPTEKEGLLAGFWLLGFVAMVPWAVWGAEGKNRSLEALEMKTSIDTDLR